MTRHRVITESEVRRSARAGETSIDVTGAVVTPSGRDAAVAANAREHNNANVLTLGAGLIGARLATAILDAFLATPFAAGRHNARVEKIDALDRPG